MALPMLAKGIGSNLIKGGRKKKISPQMMAPTGGSNGSGKGGALVAKPSASLTPKSVSSSAIVKAPKAKVTSARLSMADILVVIRKDVNFIESFLNFDLTNKTTKLAGLKKDKSKKRLEKEEKISESKLKKPKFGLKLPKSGIVDGVKNFIGNMLMGMFVLKIMDFLKGKNIGAILKAAGAAVDFIIGVGGTLLDGLATFVDIGVKAYDATLGFIGKFGGQGAIENFEKVSNLINNALFLTTAIAGAMAVEAMMGGGGDGPTTGIQGMRGQAGRVTRGGTTAAAARRYAARFGRDAAVQRFGTDGVRSLGGRFGRSQLTNLGRGLAVRALGKRGAATAIRSAAGVLKPLVSKVPIVGGVIEFVLSWISGDPVGKAAFKGVGTTLGTFIGGALGTLIPIPFVGTAIGTFLGGAGGSALGGVIYDAIFGGKRPKAKTSDTGDVSKMKGGGRARASGSRRPPKKKKSGLRKIPQKPTYTKEPLPKSSESLGTTTVQNEKAWWDPAGVFTGGDSVQEVKASRDVSRRIISVQNKLGDDDYFGPILAITSKLIRGQRPTFKDYQNIGLGLNLLYQEGMKEGVLGGMPTKKYSNGGSVTPEVASEDISKWVQKTFEDQLRNKIQNALTLNVPETVGSPGSRPSTPSSEIPSSVTQGSTYATASSGEYSDILNLIASVEAKSYDTINGGHIDGLSTMTISNARQAALNAGYGSGAMGRYQQMPQFVLDRARSVGLDPDKDLFNPENQDKLAILLIDGAGYKKWKAGELTTEKFAYHLAGTWRGLPEGPSNLTYQDQYASGNKAHTTWDNVMNVLGGSKRSGSVATGNVTVPQLSAGAPAAPSTSGPADVSDLSVNKKGGIYLHWSAGSGMTAHPTRYHRTILADGSVVGTQPLDQFKFGEGHTAYRNSRGVGLAIAAMAGWNWSTIKPIQLEKLAETAATIAKGMGYSAADINVRNIATHAEVGSMKDGVRNPSYNGRDPDNYGPSWPGWGGDGNKSDFVDINKADYNKQLGQGGPKLRAMILAKFKAMKQGGYIGKYDQSMKSIESFAPYESGAEQIIMVPLPSQGQSMPMMDTQQPNTSLPTTVFADDQFEFLDYQG